MARNYRNVALNLSVTAASDSSKGLFFNRNPRLIVPDLLKLPITQSSKDSNRPNLVQRYVLVDNEFRRDKVSQSPVYRREWIIQEMLLALRVIHFLDDQIARECACFRAAESFPYGGISFGTTVPDLYNTCNAFGVHRPDITSYLRSTGPRKGAKRVIAKWDFIAQIYTTTLLSKPNDKLVALSGIAELISMMIQTPFIAGFWEFELELELESQFTWYVKSEYGLILKPFPPGLDHIAPQASPGQASILLLVSNSLPAGPWLLISKN
jgi:hypothetical protein